MFRQTLVNPNANKLGLRDPAVLALMVGLAANGADFGDEMGDDWGDDWGDEVEGDDIASELAAEFGDEVGAAVRARLRGKARASTALAKTNPAQVAMWNKMSAVKRRSDSRMAKLDPNRGSTVKIEDYELPLSQAITYGTTVAFTTLQANPQTTFKPEALICNAPMPGFAFLSDIKVANVSASVTAFVTDAYSYNANAVRSRLSLPKLSPQNVVSITGSYTGVVPAGFLAGATSFFCATLYGPSTMAGG